MSPINHFYVFVVNQEEEQVREKSSLRYQHTQQCDDLSSECIQNRVLWLLVLVVWFTTAGRASKGVTSRHEDDKKERHRWEI
jgi:hypothetical protein